MSIGISWFALVVLVAVLVVLVRGLANPRTRPFVIGLGAIVGLGFVFIFFARFSAVQRLEPPRPIVISPNFKVERGVEESPPRSVVTSRKPEIIAPPAPSPPKSSAAESQRPKVSFIAVLGQAIVQAWTTRAPAPTTAASKPAEANQPDLPPKPQPPDWVNAPPRMEDSCYRQSVRVGPFTTPLECERDLTKALQGAVAEYAELSHGHEAAAVRLPDDALQNLVQERWTEVRPMEIGGTMQDMHSLHALVVIDAPVQQRIKAEAQQIVSSQRVKAAGVLLGGVLGLLALAWGGLRWATRRPATV